MEGEDYIAFDGTTSKLVHRTLSQDIFFSSSSAHTIIKANAIFSFFQSKAYFSTNILKFSIFL